MLTTTEKLNFLNGYLLDKHHISLSKILEIDDKHFNEILEGKKKPSQELLTRVAEFFYFDVSLLTDEDKELPHESSLQVDEMLLSARQGEYVNEIEKKKNKNVIKRNFNLLDKKDKKRLIVNLVLTALPFLALVLYSCISSWSDAASTLSNYKNGDTLSTSQQKLEDSLPKQDEGSRFATIKVGAEIDEITNISASDETFVAT